ncbi:MAG: hypothetical protein Kapaf2KO_17190 [Candidatus Kapaibacteriales bacterium]
MIKKVTYLLVLLLFGATASLAQEKLVITDFDYSAYPEINVDFFLSDNSDTPVGFTSQDFEAINNGRNLQLNSIQSNTDAIYSDANHHIIILDLALSEVGAQSSMLATAKKYAEEYINRLDEDEKVSVIAFSDIADLVVRFAEPNQDLIDLINGLQGERTSDLDVAFYFPNSGLEDFVNSFVSDGEYDSSVLLLTGSYSDFSSDISTFVSNNGLRFNTAYFIRDIREGLIDITEAGNGYYSERIRNTNEIDDFVTKSILSSKGFTSSTASLKDILNCDVEHAFAMTLMGDNNVQQDFSIEDAVRPLIEADPSFLSFSSVLPGDSKSLFVNL